MGASVLIVICCTCLEGCWIFTDGLRDGANNSTNSKVYEINGNVNEAYEIGKTELQMTEVR